MKTVYLSIVASLLGVLTVVSQSDLNQFLKPSDSLNPKRRNAVVISEIGLGTATLIGLDQLWYADFPRSSFRTVNDSDEWLQMDKLGHVFSAYHLNRVGAEVLNWSGVRKKDQLLYGTALSLGFLTTVEIFDGFSKEWGFSWSDMAANFAGSGLYVGQELLWEEQRVLLKYSFSRTRFAKQNPDKLGASFLEEMIKDYNGQTIWLSANLRSFMKKSKIPKWLNVAVGYGAEGMLTGRASADTVLFPDQNRYRQFYLSLDLDLTKIETNSHVLKTLFSLINVLKIPAPTLGFSTENKLTFHLLFY